MIETNTVQLVFALSVARELASFEGPDFDLVVFHIQQALQAARDEALRKGIVVEIEGDETIQ
ncbi:MULTISPECIES: hypothetical protein [unclassified Rhizobium]|uniref:hypothetical protein n=1 Tax=unclassified Rhizobium TaxID=2613769 RepID=UPI00160A33BA|nr:MULTISPECIES: hypothetical protein [unclassified Rhizobium]MBB3318030.1 hypothetical protein [Rhizobium sp. BK181]MBB3544242.1 hypothetical protein [Rhizobium sp. BK399]MCS3742918.1 hypothetical protein [Rhizobium sp. BK661]MCS4095069.1 hypothetical protein [Rhizobium sp. BK176]